MTSGAHTPSSDDGSSWLRRVGPLLLVLGSAGSANLFEAFGLRLSADRILGLAAVAVWAVLAARSRPRWTRVHAALAVFAGVQVLASALNARAWPEGLKFSAIYVMGFCCFALAAECARGPGGQRRMLRAWIGVAVAVAVVGVASAIASNALQDGLWGSGGAQLLSRNAGRARVLYAAKATFNEWNLFSSFLLIPLSLTLWSWKGAERGRPGLGAAVGAIVWGLVFGVTRAAWLALAGLVALFWWSRRLAGRHLLALGLMVAAAFAVQAIAVGGSPIRARVVQPLADRYDWNMAGRWAISVATLRSVARAPIIGHGAGSTNSLKVSLAGGALLPKVWNGNAILFVLHDSGLVGLVALVALCAVVGRRAVRSIRRAGGSPAAGLVPPLLAAAGALALGFMFTHGLWLMYPYVFLGFLTAATESPSDGA